MLNWPKKLNAVSTKVLLQFCLTVCRCPIHILLKKLGHTWAHFALKTSAGRVSIFNTHRIRFSQRHLQNVSILAFFNFLQSLYTRSGYQYFYKQNLISSRDASSQKFENSQLSLSGSHQLILIITIIFK
jgi:hypothetical protein